MSKKSKATVLGALAVLCCQISDVNVVYASDKAAAKVEKPRFMSYKKYLSKLQSFADEVPVDPRLGEKYGIKKQLVLTPPSILRGACGGDEERIKYFMGLLNNPDQLVANFKETIENARVLRKTKGDISILDISEEEETDRQEATEYKIFVLNLLDKNKHIESFRVAIVLFLAALEYRKKIQPKTNFCLHKDKSFGCDFRETNGIFTICLLTNEEKCPNDFKERYFTSQHIVDHEYFQKHASTVVYEWDSYTFFHEFMHMVAILCGFYAGQLSLMATLNHPLISNLLDPHFELTDDLKHSLVDQYIAQSIQGTNREVTVKALLDMLLADIHLETEIQEIQDIIKPKIQSMKEMIDSNEVFFAQTKLIDIKQTEEGFEKFFEIMSAMMDYTYEHYLHYSWETPEELFRILGILALEEILVINRVSDLNYLVKSNKLVRVSHCSDKGDMQFKLNLLAKLGPTKDSLRHLFSLHSLNYDEYK